MNRLRTFLAFSLTVGLITATVAQDKKDPAPPAKADVKKDEPKKAEPGKVEAKKDAVPAAADNELALKFTKDVPYFQELTTKTIQNIKVQGLDVGQNQSQTFQFKFEPKSQSTEGKWLVTQTIEGIKMMIDIAGAPISYDSASEGGATGTNSALSEFFKALKGSQFSLTIGKDGGIEKIDGREEFIKKLINTNKQLETLLNKVLSEESMKQMADPSFGMSPKEKKKVGEKWDRKVKLVLGPLGTYDNTYTYTYKAQTGDVADIDVAVALSYVPPGATEGGEALPFRIKAGKIEQTKDDKSNKGSIKFNTKTGRIDSATVAVKMTGTLTLDIGGTVTEVNLSQEQATDLKSQDKSFMSAAAKTP